MIHGRSHIKQALACTWPALAFLAALLPAGCSVSAPSASSAPPAPVELSAEQDHARLMKRLGIKALRRGADWDTSSPHAANYDESKADEHLASLPDLLVLTNGDRVKTAADWWRRRRPELVALFDREIYGRVPDDVPRVVWKVQSVDRDKVGDIKVVHKTLSGHADNASYPPIDVNIELSLTLPATAPEPIPVMLAINVGEDFWQMLRGRMNEEQFNAFYRQARQWQQQVLARGWAYAELIATSVQADNGEGLTHGIIRINGRSMGSDSIDLTSLPILP